MTPEAQKIRNAPVCARLGAKRLTELAGEIAEWRAGTLAILPYDATEDSDGGAMLRIVGGDTVQTSLGAEVPLADARRVMAFYGDILLKERNFALKCRIGRFTLDSIDADGNIRAGCHLITRAELENFVKLLEQEVTMTTYSIKRGHLATLETP